MTHRVLRTVASLAFALCIASSALAHEGKHTGTSLHGTVVSLSGDTLKIKTEAAEVAVTLTDKTKITAGTETVRREDLVAGAHVDVHGTKLPGGGFAAQAVEIKGQTEEPHSEHSDH